MLKSRQHLFRIALYVYDIVVIVASFYVAYLIRKALPPVGFLKELAQEEPILWLLLPIVIIWSILLWRFELYRGFRRKGTLEEVWAVFKVVAVGSILLFATTYISRSFYVSRAFLGIFAVTNFLLFTLNRLAVNAIVHHYIKRGYDRLYVLIIGTGKMARNMIETLERHKDWGIEIVGCLSESSNVQVEAVGNYKVLGSVQDIQSILKERVIDEVYLAISRERLSDADVAVRTCDDMGIRVRIAMNYFSELNSRIYLEHLSGIPLLTFSSTPHNEVALMVKRIMDIIASMILLIATSVVFLTSALAIKLTSKGPAFFRQKRVGMNGRIFTLYKFRTMFENAEAMKEKLAHLNEAEGPVFKIKDDPRITKVGRWLRKLSIDELPQLWNVLKGDMSLVGPRPPVPSEVEKYERWQRRRLSMRPGITCIWQVEGRSGVDFTKWMEMDLEYIDNWSLGQDFKLLMKTIPAVLSSKGAY